jgi:hypothetical protein
MRTTAHGSDDSMSDEMARQGRLIGRMEALGFRLREEALLNTMAQDFPKSSEIEGPCAIANARSVFRSGSNSLDMKNHYGGISPRGSKWGQADNGNTHSTRVCDSRSLLKIISNEHMKNSSRFNSTWTWATSKEKEEPAKAAPALRIWLRMCEVVDPDGEVFKERKRMAEALKAIQK